MEQSNFSKIVNVLRIAYPYYFKDMEKKAQLCLINYIIAN